MGANAQTPWYLRKPKSWTNFQSIPWSRLWVLFLAVFTLFSTFGFYGDLMGGGTTPAGAVLAGVLWSGIVAATWIVVLARLPAWCLVFPFLLSFSNPVAQSILVDPLERIFPMKPMNAALGIQFAATGTMIAIILSYFLFIMFIRREGKESFKLRNELDLAHGIQKTLVPPFTLRTSQFEAYGVSVPSDKVGGDLVDALTLPDGDAIAYLGDIAGHGLQAGILMGMLKTATRTALLEAVVQEPGKSLPVLLHRLNTVLPAVKEAHMYATFSAFRLCADGNVYYALAASPPILHWHSNGLTLTRLEEEQFPLGLLDVAEFNGERMRMECGDLIVVATDGILEASDRQGEEFGIQRLEATITASAVTDLPQLAERILAAAQTFGRQTDDQTILLIRRTA
jgi:serine phosphatase RsbU (regulator of sigma subunit)